MVVKFSKHLDSPLGSLRLPPLLISLAIILAATLPLVRAAEYHDLEDSSEDDAPLGPTLPPYTFTPTGPRSLNSSGDCRRTLVSWEQTGSFLSATLDYPAIFTPEDEKFVVDVSGADVSSITTETLPDQPHVVYLGFGEGCRCKRITLTPKLASGGQEWTGDSLELTWDPKKETLSEGRRVYFSLNPCRVEEKSGQFTVTCKKSLLKGGVFLVVQVSSGFPGVKATIAQGDRSSRRVFISKSGLGTREVLSRATLRFDIAYKSSPEDEEATHLQTISVTPKAKARLQDEQNKLQEKQRRKDKSLKDLALLGKENTDKDSLLDSEKY